VLLFLVLLSLGRVRELREEIIEIGPANHKLSLRGLGVGSIALEGDCIVGGR
jgi:hypothetical protein